MDRKRRTQRLTLAAFFVAVQAVMTVTPVGYLPIGALSITTMHIPVILAGILIGPSFGAVMGFVFGLSSMLRATFSPGLTSFVFSPFITVGGISGNFSSLLIVFVPRILLGWLSGKTYRMLVDMTGKESLSAMISAGLNTVIHTLLVMGGIWAFFGAPYASVLGISRTFVFMPVFLVGFYYKEYQQKLNGWIGKSAEELYDTWGFPPQTTPLGDNKIMVTYFYSADAPIDDDYEPYAGQLSYNAMAVPTFGLSSAEPLLYYCQTSFILHNDVVVDFNFSGDDCK